MTSDSVLISMVENHPYPANFKDATSGKYIACNVSNAKQLRMRDPHSVVGLTIHDMQYAKSDWGASHVAIMAALDFHVRDKKITGSSCQAILDASGAARLEEVVKSPIIGHSGKVLGILSFQRDLTSTLPLSDVYDLYRRFYNKPQAIRRMLQELGVTDSFAVLPTEAQIKVLFGKAERLTSKEISKTLGISHRTVECQVENLSHKVADGDLRRVLAQIKRKSVLAKQASR